MFHTNDVYISTFTGMKVPVFDMKPYHVNLFDIAHALSNKCRFTGHTRKFYSVAEHSLRVYTAALNRFPAMSAKMKFHLLFHDAPEAYLPDFAAPIKWAAQWIVSRNGLPTVVSAEQLEAEVFGAICRRYDVTPLDSMAAPIVKEFDRLLAATEGRDLMGGCQWPMFPEPLENRIEPLTERVAENGFLCVANKILLELEEEKNG